MRIRLAIAGMALLSVALLVAWKAGSASPGASRGVDRSEAEDRPSRPVEYRVVRASAELNVFAEPGTAGPALTLPARTAHGSPRALRVLRERGDWVEVVLPIRPNQARGWVRSADVELRTVTTAVVVDLERRRLAAYDSGKRVFSSPVAVGTTQNPTPRGEFFVTDLLAVPNADGPYGPYAIGLSAYSESLTEFAGGDGQVGIHGTNDPASIGSAVSHGCVRLPNDAVAKLFELVSLGTPVVLA